MRGGGTLDRVVMNEPRVAWVRMYKSMGGYVYALAIMTDNNMLQTKFIGYNQYSVITASFTNNPFHMVIEDVWKNTGTSTSDATMDQKAKIYINNDGKYSLCGTWTSTVKPDNTRVELDCEVVKTDGNIVTAKCISETRWSNSVFNRIPIYVGNVGAYIGVDNLVNNVLFGTNSFSTEGSITQSWDGSTQYNVTTNDDGSSLIIGNQFTIKDLPTDFVSHWVDTIHAEALMGNNRIILIPPKSP